MNRFDYVIQVASSLALAGCLNPSSSTSAAPSDMRAVQISSPPVANPGAARLVIWDGARIRPRNIGFGRDGHIDFWDGGKGWADCDSKPCKAELAAKSGAGVDGKKGLRFHAEGLGWAGGGWGWFGWYPPTAGTDLSPYNELTFLIRVGAKSPEAAPDPARVGVQLACSTGKRTTARVMVHDYDGYFDDGNWHKIVIPMVDLRKGDGAEFDPTTAWEFQLSTWSVTPRDFDIYIDQIAVEK
jgi:hypothetical protein